MFSIFFYGFLNEDETDIIQWVIIKLDMFRKYYESNRQDIFDYFYFNKEDDKMFSCSVSSQIMNEYFYARKHEIDCRSKNLPYLLLSNTDNSSMFVVYNLSCFTMDFIKAYKNLSKQILYILRWNAGKRKIKS